MHNEFGEPIPAYRDWHRNDARRRAMKSRRARGVRPIQEVNAEKAQEISKTKQGQVEQVLLRHRGIKPLNTAELARQAGVAWDTAKKYSNGGDDE
jgi:hypothetical protein